MKLGFCGWLLDGVSLPERVAFLASEGFSSIAWLQGIMNADRQEREEAAHAIRENKFSLTFHGNVQANLTPDNKIDMDFAARLFDDVIWWHEHTNGVVSCCSDAISAVPAGSVRTYLPDETFRLFQMEADFFGKYGIGYGIENSCGMPSGKGYSSLGEMQRIKNLLVNAPDAGMILDTGHAHVYLTSNSQERTGLDEYVEKLPFRIYELHVTDNHGTRDEHLLPGCGTLDFARMRSGLDRRNFDGIVSLEICVDILNDKYGWDISKQENRDVIRRAKDDFLAAYFK